MPRLLLLLPFVLAAAPATQAPLGLAPAQAGDQAHDLKLRMDTSGRMTVPVTLGPDGPYRFLVDTGAERTVISRELAARLGLGAGKPATMQSVVAISPVSTVDIPEIQVSTRNLAINGAPMLLGAHIGADGMLGVDSLASQQVLLDFKRGVMGISPSGQVRERDDPNTIVVTARRRHGRLLFTDATISNRSVVVVVDTGSEVTIGNAALRRRLAFSKRPSLSEIVTVAGERATAEIIVVPTLRVGGMRIENVEIAFLDAPVFRQLELDDRPAILLGMNVMRAFDRVSIDFATKRVRFVLPNTSMIRETRLASN